VSRCPEPDLQTTVPSKDERAPLAIFGVFVDLPVGFSVIYQRFRDL